MEEKKRGRPVGDNTYSTPKRLILLPEGWYTYKELVEFTGLEYKSAIKNVYRCGLKKKFTLGYDIFGRRTKFAKFYWPGHVKYERGVR